MTDQSVSSPSEEMDRRATDFRKIALWTGAATILLYLLAVHTSIGQSWDDTAVLERAKAGKKQIARAQEVLETIRLPFLIGVLALIVIIGVCRKRVLPAVAAASVFIGTVFLAEALKIVLPRQELSDLESQVKFDGLNTFPSGHATIATSLVFAFILVCSVRVRPWIAIVGVIGAATVAWGTLAAGWHRPSDAVGGVLLAMTCFAAASAWLLPRFWHPVLSPPLTRILVPVGVLSLSLIAVSARAITWWAPPDQDWQLDSAAYVVASVSILACTGFAILSFAWLLRSVDLR